MPKEKNSRFGSGNSNQTPISIAVQRSKGEVYAVKVLLNGKELQMKFSEKSELDLRWQRNLLLHNQEGPISLEVELTGDSLAMVTIQLIIGKTEILNENLAVGNRRQSNKLLRQGIPLIG